MKQLGMRLDQQVFGQKSKVVSSTRALNMVASFIQQQGLEVGKEGMVSSKGRYVELLNSSGKPPTATVIQNGIAIQLRPLQKRGLHYAVLKGLATPEFAKELSQSEERDLKEGSLIYLVSRIEPPKVVEE